MSYYDDDGYKRGNDGSFWDADEAEAAADNGDLKRLFDGSYWDPDTDEEYWSDGEKK